ncbi:serine/threonine-protein kinase [Haloferula sp. BvORR071]|uniref:serine/threonine-protein kinase n=1 Tax=Haloferula sp. BvORR071 TaxID=1396141 RepID=UPI00069718D1|nr:serine/threonine-protein kinase [Haloferula sp. BvORR071]
MSLSPLQRLFQEASELPADEQAAYLERATNDEALRRRVSDLLESASRSPDFLGSPTLDSRGNPVADAVASPLSPGSRIGPYELLRKLGSGGGGIVFLARQEQPLEREVCLKVMRATLDDEEPRWRFEIERQAIARMEHPGIARVLDAGLTDDGRPWIAMEYIPGDAITTWCDAHELGLDQRAGLMAAVCDAVHHAHQKGVLHRDLKPSNVLVTSSAGAAPRPCLIDFGIACLNDSATDSRQTRPGRLPGTPAYMSPEQIHGDPDALDARTDIFSLGVILYELLTGVSPFREPNSASREVTPPERSTRLELAGDVAALAQRRGETPQAWQRALRGDLALIALKCLRRDPAERYASADALAADLRAYVARLPVSASRPTWSYLASRMIRRHPYAAAAVVVMLLVLAAASAAILHAQRRAVAERKRAEDLFTGFARLIVAGNPEFGRSKDYPLRQAVFDFAEHLPEELTRDPRTEARARHTLADALQGMGETAKAQEQFARALGLLEAMPGEDSADLLPLALFGNAISVSETQPELARGQMMRAEGMLGHSDRPHDRYMRIRALCHLSVLAHDRDKLEDAERLARQALGLADAQFAGDRELIAKCLWTLARVERSLNRMGEARALQARRLSLIESAMGADSPQVWDTKAELALLDLGTGDPAAQLAILEDMARRTENHFGAVHAQSLARWIDYARALALTGKREEALKAYRETIAKAANAPSFKEPATLARWREEARELQER